MDGGWKGLDLLYRFSSVIDRGGGVAGETDKGYLYTL